MDYQTHCDTWYTHTAVNRQRFRTAGPVCQSDADRMYRYSICWEIVIKLFTQFSPISFIQRSFIFPLQILHTLKSVWFRVSCLGMVNFFLLSIMCHVPQFSHACGLCNRCYVRRTLILSSGFSDECHEEPRDVFIDSLRPRFRRYFS